LNTDLDHIVQNLKRAGLKATQQRIVILSTLYEHLEHPSSEEVYKHVKKSHPSISLGTVYKTLESFVDSGLIHKVATSDGLMRYDGHTLDHNHIYISNTQEIIDFKDEKLTELIIKYMEEKEIQNLDIKKISLRIEGEKIDLKRKVNIK
jgi:Fur family peroxide stress response transcriptional regulator